MGREAYIPARKRAEIEAESARLILNLRELPIELLRILSSRQLVALFKTKLSHGTILNYREEILKEREGEMAGEKGIDRHRPVVKQPDSIVISQQVLLERVGSILAKSYPHLGDNEKISEADALRLIYREVKRYDPTILERNLRSRLPK